MDELVIQRRDANAQRERDYERRLKALGLLHGEDRKRRMRIGRRIQARLAALRSNPKLGEVVL